MTEEVGKNPAAISSALIGVTPADGMREVLQRSKLRVLFEAQEIGRHEPSAATAGTLLYVAGMMARIQDAELAPYYAEISSLVDSTGSVQMPAEFRTTVETNWSDAWCLAAALKRPHLFGADQLSHLAFSLLDRQERSGGWGLRPDRPGRPHPLFCLPVTMAIRELRRSSVADASLITAAAGNLVSYLRRSPSEPTVVRLLRAAELQLLGAEPGQEILETLHADIWRAGELSLESVEIGREDQPLWYTKIDRSLMVLAARRLWPILDPVNVGLASEIINRFDPAQMGWRNHRNDQAISTWRSAESYLAIALITGDLTRAGISLETWNTRREVSTELKVTDGFDVGISFSSVQREIAVRIKVRLREAGLTVFYDEDYQHELLGTDLNAYLHNTYLRRCRYAITVLSREFLDSKWSGGVEWQAILARLSEQPDNFLLPYYVGDVVVPGLNPSIGFLRSVTHSPEQFADVAIKKILADRSAREAYS